MYVYISFRFLILNPSVVKGFDFLCYGVHCSLEIHFDAFNVRFLFDDLRCIGKSFGCFSNFDSRFNFSS